MKKIIGILSFFLAAGFIACVILGFAGNIPKSVPQDSASAYKMLIATGYFLRFLPAIVITGFTVSFSVYFGNNCEGSTSRFSTAMIGRFRMVLISAVVCAFVLTLTSEVFGNVIARGKYAIINRPKLINQYIKVGEELFGDGEYEKSYLYACAALKLSPNSPAATALRDKSDVEITREKTSNIRFELYNKAFGNKDSFETYHIEKKQISDAYKCLLNARSCFEREEWINAHYYAQQGLKLYSPKDPNVQELKSISTEAWNNISAKRNLAKNAENEFYEKKYKGYLALVQNDDLSAYYIFRDLFLSSREYSTDPDVVFYLDVASRRIDERCFFDDEVLQLQSFEDVNDVCFSYTYKDGSKDIIYFKGMTSVKETGRVIQYLRDVTIKNISAENKLYRTMTVPYAKVLPVSLHDISGASKELLGIDASVTIVPYIMLNSVGRDNPEIRNMPLYVYENGETTNIPEYIILPMAYSDFAMLETQTSEPDKIPFGILFRLVKNASRYGYSNEVYLEALMNRIFYPFWIVILLIGFASIAWNYRMGTNQFFRMSWIFGFPVLIIISHYLNKWLLYIFKLLNYVISGVTGNGTALLAGFAFYTAVFFGTAVYFAGRRSTE